MCSYRLGIDIGGTFTDFVIENTDSGKLHIGKTATTQLDPSIGVITGLKKLVKEIGISFKDIDVLIHGTTLATNAVIERKGALTGLLTTQGFEDILEIGRESRYDYYDLQLDLPSPLVTRQLRRGVVERMDANGNVITKIDDLSLESEIKFLIARGVQSIAVSYLHSYRNSAHEIETAKKIHQISPSMPVSCSFEVSPEVREFERTSTTVINAYLKPILEKYLEKLHQKLLNDGFKGSFLLMLSSGLLTNVHYAKEFPSRLIESGPAGGAMLGSFYSKLTGIKNIIAFDMGGTTAKASLIHNGIASVGREFEVGRIERFKRGSGYPVRTPCVDIEEIGTGGGSIAWINVLGHLKVGPNSAAANPGPACYGLGGENPTVTDADLVLGYLDQEYFLGGEMKLDRVAAEKAIMEKIALPLGLTLTQAAWGIHRVANEEMANAFRIHAMEQGRDPARYSLLAFGGAGPIHAYGVARLLRSPKLISPSSSGVASALGFLVAPLASEYSKTYISRIDRIDWLKLNQLLNELEKSGRDFLKQSKVDEKLIKVSRSADMQYFGQMHDIHVPLPLGNLELKDEENIRNSFYESYKDLFQRSVTRIPVEVLTWRVTVGTPAPEVDLKWRELDAKLIVNKKEIRNAYFDELGDYFSTSVYDRYSLKPGDKIVGPAIIEERESTFIIGPNSNLTVDKFGSLLVDL